MPDIVSLVKQAAVEAVEAMKPVQLLFGQVTSAAPLKISVGQKVVLTEKMLVLTRSVTDYDCDVTVSHATGKTGGGAGEAAFEAHAHTYKGKKKFRVHGALTAGDWVVLARVQNGKRYIVLDRIAPVPEVKGEWV